VTGQPAGRQQCGIRIVLSNRVPLGHRLQESGGERNLWWERIGGSVMTREVHSREMWNILRQGGVTRGGIGYESKGTRTHGDTHTAGQHFNATTPACRRLGIRRVAGTTRRPARYGRNARGIRRRCQRCHHCQGDHRYKCSCEDSVNELHDCNLCPVRRTSQGDVAHPCASTACFTDIPCFQGCTQSLVGRYLMGCERAEQ